MRPPMRGSDPERDGRRLPMQGVLRVWFLATGLFLSVAMIWAFVPVLVPILGLTAAIGIVVAGMVALARWIERLRSDSRSDSG